MPDSLQSFAPAFFTAGLQVLRLCIWLVLLAVVFLPLERLFALHPHRIFRKEVGTDLFLYFVSSLVPALLLSLPLSITAWTARHLLPDAYFAWMLTLPLFVRVMLSFVVGEIGFYWGHRWTHEVPVLWRFHAIHHSAEHMDFLVNTRAHPIDVVFTRLCGLVPLYILGLGSPVRGAASTLPLLVVLLGTLWGFFIHSNVRWRLGVLEELISTPAFHHWHHTNDGAEVINKNYASMLPILDRVFRTMYLPGQHPETYGIHESSPAGPLQQLVYPFRTRRRKRTSGNHAA